MFFYFKANVFNISLVTCKNVYESPLKTCCLLPLFFFALGLVLNADIVILIASLNWQVILLFFKCSQNIFPTLLSLNQVSTPRRNGQVWKCISCKSRVMLIVPTSFCACLHWTNSVLFWDNKLLCTVSSQFASSQILVKFHSWAVFSQNLIFY